MHNCAKGRRMKAIIIDAKNREIREETIPEDRLKFLQECVEGYIERAITLPNGDDVFVNEEGLLISFDYGFYIRGGHQIFAGNGVVVGDDDVELSSSVEQINDWVVFAKKRDTKKVMDQIQFSKDYISKVTGIKDEDRLNRIQTKFITFVAGALESDHKAYKDINEAWSYFIGTYDLETISLKEVE